MGRNVDGLCGADYCGALVLRALGCVSFLRLYSAQTLTWSLICHSLKWSPSPCKCAALQLEVGALVVVCFLLLFVGLFSCYLNMKE